jgi:hypothetical protein
MILKVSNRRYRQLTAGKVPGEVYDRERRCLVKGGHAEATPVDTARMERAKAKRDRKAAKVAKINPACFAA